MNNYDNSYSTNNHLNKRKSNVVNTNNSNNQQDIPYFITNSNKNLFEEIITLLKEIKYPISKTLFNSNSNNFSNTEGDIDNLNKDTTMSIINLILSPSNDRKELINFCFDIIGISGSSSNTNNNNNNNNYINLYNNVSSPFIKNNISTFQKFEILGITSIFVNKINSINKLKSINSINYSNQTDSLYKKIKLSDEEIFKAIEGISSKEYSGILLFSLLEYTSHYIKNNNNSTINNNEYTYKSKIKNNDYTKIINYLANNKNMTFRNKFNLDTINKLQNNNNTNTNSNTNTNNNIPLLANLTNEYNTITNNINKVNKKIQKLKQNYDLNYNLTDKETSSKTIIEINNLTSQIKEFYANLSHYKDYLKQVNTSEILSNNEKVLNEFSKTKVKFDEFIHNIELLFSSHEKLRQISEYDINKKNSLVD